MNTLIFADVHLKVTADEGEVRKEFAAFLRQIDAARCDRVIILGDLFDFWFEYRHVVFSGYFDVLRAFAELHDQGVALHLVCGNHDFWAGRFLEEQLGFTIHRGPFPLEMGARRVLFAHGDGINSRDFGYRAYKRFARSRPVIWLFRRVHPDWAMAIAQGVSHSSRTLLQPEDPSEGREVGALRSYAQGVIERGEADVVMCGHSHHPEEQEFSGPNGGGVYINTGDWSLNRTFVEWDGQSFERKTYAPDEGD